MLRAIASGFVFLARSSPILVGLWLVLLAVAIPGSVAVGHSISASAGDSLAADELIAGFDMSWFGEYEDVATGLGRTFRPELMGAGAFLQNLEGWLDGGLFTDFPPVVAVGIVFALLWTFLMAGVVERAVHGKSRRSFGQAMGYWGFRFVRLALLGALCYWAVYSIHGTVFDRLADHTDSMTSERSVLMWSLAGYGLTALLLVLVHVAFDYAKIATVAGERGSALLAAIHGFGVVLRNPLRTLGLFFCFAAAAGLVLALYGAIAPGAGTSSWATVLVAFLLGQAMVIAKLKLRLARIGAETALYMSLSESASRGR